MRAGKILLKVMIAMLLLAGCAMSDGEKAEKLVETAMDHYKNKRYNSAKLLLDSVIFSYSGEKKIVRAAKELQKSVLRVEQEKNLQYLDSLLLIKEAAIVPVMKNFVVEDPGSSEPRYISKHQQAVRAFERCYLRLHTNKNGVMTLSSHYTGEHHIGHRVVKVKSGEQYCVTDSVGDGVYYHGFESDGISFESVRFANGADNGVVEFIADNYDRRLEVSLINERGRTYRYYMTETDRKAIRDVYELAMLQRELVQIKAQIRSVKTSLR